MSKMSQENLLEMGELYHELDDMVPERDTGQKPKPKPRSRHRSSTMSTSTPNKLGTASGVNNPSFTVDENQNDSRNPSWGWSGHRKAGDTDTFNDPSSSEDSLMSPSLKARRTPISVVSDVQVHHSFDDPSGDSVNTTDGDDRTSLRFENETKPKRERPKPKPRTKSGLSSSENDTENIEPRPRQKSRQIPDTSPPDDVISSPKEDFLTVTIPVKEIESKPEADEQPQVKSGGIFGIMKNKARNFLSTKSTSESKSVEATPGVEPIEIKSQKSKSSPVPASTSAPEEFELKPAVVQKRKSARRRDAETSRDQIALDKDESAILNPKTSTTTPLSSSKRDKRRRESQTCITKLLGATIHNSDMLPSDPNILHPLVKVTVMDQNGLYLTRSDCGEEPSLITTKIQKQRRGKKADNLEEEATSGRTKEKLSVHLKKTSVLPILTQTYEINRQVPSFAPTWNELLVFEEPFERFVSEESSVIFFFEIMDFLPMSNAVIRRGWGDYHGGEPGWYKIAWAFLKPVGTNGIRNVNRKLRLQLYKPEALTTSEKQHGPEVYCWWKLEKRAKINATLYVTLKGITPPSGAAASLRTLLTMRKEHLTQAILDSQLASTKKSRKKRAKDLERKQGALDLQRPQWTRHEGQSCKVPNKLMASLPSSQVASLNLTVCGNVHAAKFSPCGLKLAAGLDTDELHIVLIFEIPSGTLLKNLRGHHGLIYDLDWKPDLTQENGEHSHVRTNFLASASADSTVLVWKIGDESNCQLIKTFSHPSFVYCVKFHPTQPNLIITGCFDYIIRIWDYRESIASSESSPAHSSATSPIILLDRHFSFVNCIAIQPTGEFLFSGDGSGSLYKWKITSRNKRKWALEQNIKLSESGKHPINDIVVHPNGNRLLVQVRDSCLKIVDIESLLTLQTFTGLVNEKLQIRSCLSPCGNLVLSGSEDASLCIWDADTGRILEFITPENHPNCIVTSVDYHPFDHYVVIGLSSLISEPNPVMIYAYVSPEQEQSQTPGHSLPLSTVIRLKSNLRRQRGAIESEDQLALNRTVTFAPTRGDSTEKFIKIIKKLDTALKVRKLTGQGHLTQELQNVTGEEEILTRENELLAEGGPVMSVKPKARARSLTEENVIQIFPKEITENEENWSISSISKSPPQNESESRVRNPKSESESKARPRPRPRPSSAAAISASERAAMIVTPRSEQVATPDSDTTTGSSSKREKRRRQIQEKNSGLIDLSNSSEDIGRQ